MSALSRAREFDPLRYDREYLNGTPAEVRQYVADALGQPVQPSKRAAMAPVRNRALATALDTNSESDWADFWASDAVGR